MLFWQIHYQWKRMIICHSAILESSVKKEINYFNGVISQLQHFPWGFLIYLTCSSIPSFSVMTFWRKIKIFKEHYQLLKAWSAACGKYDSASHFIISECLHCYKEIIVAFACLSLECGPLRFKKLVFISKQEMKTIFSPHMFHIGVKQELQLFA